MRHRNSQYSVMHAVKEVIRTKKSSNLTEMVDNLAWWQVAIMLICCVILWVAMISISDVTPPTDYLEPRFGEYVDVEIDGVTYTQFRGEDGTVQWVGDKPDLRTPEEKELENSLHNYQVGYEMYAAYPDAYGVFCFPWDYNNYGDPIPLAYFSQVWDAVVRNDLSGGQEILDRWHDNQVARWELKQKVNAALPEYAAKLYGMETAMPEEKEAEMLRLFLYQSGASTGNSGYLTEVWEKCQNYPAAVDFTTLYYTAKAVRAAAGGDYISLIIKSKVANVFANRLYSPLYSSSAQAVLEQSGQFPLGKGISDIEPSRDDVQAALNVLALGETHLEADVVFVGMYEQGEEVVETVEIEALGTNLYFCR